MKKTTGFMAVALGLFAGSMTARAQQTKSFAEPESASTIASVMEVQLRIVESQFVPAAEAMPEDKYSFAPTNGDYKEVRTFALQLKHVATANFVFYSAILGQYPPPGATLAGTTNRLGLWVCADIVGKYGGRISMRSDDVPGRNRSVFMLFLPV